MSSEMANTKEEMLKAKEEWDNRTTQITTVAVVGGSVAGKSTLIAKLAGNEYQDSMMTLAGDGNTTSYPTTIEISEQHADAMVILPKFKSKEEIIDAVKRHLKTVLFPELKNCISSAPAEREAREQFFLDAMEKRLSPNDQTFRIHKLLGSEPGGKYHLYMAKVLKKADETADKAFHINYFEQLKSDKSKANKLLEDLIVHLLDDVNDGINYSANPMVMGLVDMIAEEAESCLGSVGFTYEVDENGYILSAWSLDIKPEDFMCQLQAITNNRRGECQSVACIIEEANIRVRGRYIGSCINDKGPHAYRLLDVVGFDNDGFNITDRVSEALLSSVPYDIVLYTTSLKYTPSQNIEFLTAIQKTIRPCQLIGALTHFDNHNVFSSDDENGASFKEVEDAVTSAKHELLDQIKSIIGPDCRARLPEGLSDIVCFSNYKGLKRLGSGAIQYFGGETNTFVPLRMAFGRALRNIRYKIKDQNIIEVSTKRDFIGASCSLDTLIHPLRQKLDVCANNEFAGIRDRASGIHHWTLDAIFWHLVRGGEHISNALVWQNVKISIYTQFAQVCFDNIKPVKFAPGVNIPLRTDRERIVKEFESNLRSELRKAAVTFFLKDQDGQDSACKLEMRKLALKPKYNKWGIMHDLLNCFLTRLGNEQWLRFCVQTALNSAAETTYARLLM